MQMPHGWDISDKTRCNEFRAFSKTGFLASIQTARLSFGARPCVQEEKVFGLQHNGNLCTDTKLCESSKMLPCPGTFPGLDTGPSYEAVSVCLNPLWDARHACVTPFKDLLRGYCASG